MTRNRSSRGRRRNRGRPGGNSEHAVTPETVADVVSEQGAAADVNAEPATSPNTSSRERRRRRPDRSGGVSEDGRQGGESSSRPRSSGDQPERRTRDQQERRSRAGSGDREAASRAGGQRSNRRRQGRRQQMQPLNSNEVFKPNLRVTGDANEPQAMRPAVLGDKDEAPVLGCPMLTRTRAEIPFAGDRHIPRCSLGWTLHSESEARYCMETPVVALCWKLHPERLEDIETDLAERAAD